jgi:WD40 repeat protein
MGDAKQRRRFFERENCSSVAAVSPDGNILASTNFKRTIDLWDMTTGKGCIVLDGHQDRVEAVVYSPDGKWLVSGSVDETLRFWSVAGGREMRKTEMPAARIRRVVFYPDGKLLAVVAEHGVIYLHDSGTGRALAQLPLAREKNAFPQGVSRGADWTPSFALAFSPDGRILAAVNKDEKVCLWDVRSRKKILTIPPAKGKNWITAISFSPNGQILASAWSDRSIRFWETRTGKNLRAGEAHQEWLMTTVSFRGNCLTVSHSTPPVFFWSRTLGDLPFRPREGKTQTDPELPEESEAAFSDPDFLVDSVAAFSPDGRTLAAASRLHGEIRLWEVLTAREIKRFPAREGICSLSFSPDGKTLASGSGDTHTIVVWDVSGLLRDGQLPPLHLPPESLRGLWDALADPLPGAAHRATWKLVAAARQSIPFLRKQLAAPPPRRVVQLIHNLDHKRYAVRAGATRELEKVLDQAEPALRRALAKNDSVEFHLRVKRLLAKLPFARLRSVRAVAVLERIGTREAREVLAQVARGKPEAWSTQEAKSALARLSQRGGIKSQ